MLPDLKKKYQGLKLTPYPSNIKVPSSQSLIFDPSTFVTKLDSTLNPSHYRLRAGNILRSVIYNSISLYPDYKKILIYTIDLSKPFNKNYINRKIYPFLMDIRDDQFDFDGLILDTITTSGSRYRLLIKDKDFDYQKILLYIKNLTKNLTMKQKLKKRKKLRLKIQKLKKPQIKL